MAFSFFVCWTWQTPAPCNSTFRIHIARIRTQNLPFLAWQNLTSGFPDGSDGKDSAYNVRDQDSIPGLERSPQEENGNPLQYSCWKIPWMEEPGGLQSVGSQRVRHDLAAKQQQSCNTHKRVSSLSKCFRFFNCCGACELCTVEIYSANKRATLPWACFICVIDQNEK